jgi:hypothetical protein
VRHYFNGLGNTAANRVPVVSCPTGYLRCRSRDVWPPARGWFQGQVRQRWFTCTPFGSARRVVPERPNGPVSKCASRRPGPSHCGPKCKVACGSPANRRALRSQPIPTYANPSGANLGAIAIIRALRGSIAGLGSAASRPAARLAIAGCPAAPPICTGFLRSPC